jgi:hypothetical protein
MWRALREAYPDGKRLAVAWRLTRDVDTCAELLAGRSVDPGRLNTRELELAQEASLVRLTRPIDLLETV